MPVSKGGEAASQDQDASDAERTHDGDRLARPDYFGNQSHNGHPCGLESDPKYDRAHSAAALVGGDRLKRDDWLHSRETREPYSSDEHPEEREQVPRSPCKSNSGDHK
jgi:hypothetical protein